MSAFDDRLDAARQLRESGARQAALAAFDDLLRDLSGSGDVESRALVARALISKALTLEDLGRADDALAAYDRVLARERAASEPSLWLEVGRALEYKGDALEKLERYGDELRIRRQIVERDGEASDPVVRAQVANALMSAGDALGKLDRRDEQLAAYELLVERESSATDLHLREWVVYALAGKARVLDELDRHDEEAAVRRLIVDREGSATEPVLQVRVAKQLVRLGLTQEELGGVEDALATYDQAIERYGLALDADVVNQVSRALTLKADALQQLGRHDEALATYQTHVDRHRASSDDRVRRRVAKAVVNRCAILWTRGDTERALEAARDLPRFEEPISTKLAEVVARARVNEGMCLARLDRLAEARATFEEILALAADPDDDLLIEDLLRAAHHNALALKKLGCSDEALECSRLAIERFGSSSGEHARPLLASLMWNYGRELGAHGRESEAMSILDELLVLIDTSDVAAQHSHYAQVQTQRAKILQGRGDLMGAANAHRAVFDRFSDVSDGYPAHAAAWAGVAAMRLLSKARRPDELTEVALAVRARYRGSKDPYLRARVRNVSVVAIAMPRANRAIDAVERRPRSYAVAAATASVAAAAAWARRRARRP